MEVLPRTCLPCHQKSKRIEVLNNTNNMWCTILKTTKKRQNLSEQLILIFFINF